MKNKTSALLFALALTAFALPAFSATQAISLPEGATLVIRLPDGNTAVVYAQHPTGSGGSGVDFSVSSGKSLVEAPGNLTPGRGTRLTSQ